MVFYPTPYTAALLAAFLLSLSVSVLAWIRRGFPGGNAFALTMLAIVIWSLMSALESAAVDFTDKVLLAKLGYIGIANVAPLFFLFAYGYRDTARRPTSPLIAVLWIIPVATIILAATNERHFLVWSDLTADGLHATILLNGHGLWYWISLIYDMLVVLAAVVLLARVALRPQRLFALQTAILLVSVAVPWIGEAIYLSPINPFPGLDLPVIGFAITGALLLFGISRYKLFDVVPVAHEILLERMGDGLIVLDDQERIVEINLAAREVFGVQSTVFGKNARDVLTALNKPLAQAGGGVDVKTEAVLAGSALRHFDIRISALRDRRGKLGGRMIVLRDITDRKFVELEREQLIDELRSALVDIKVLRGLLPICIHCRKIRDDSGYWKNLEQYVEEHSEAQFSHGLCDDCMHSLYPEYVNDEEPQNKGSPV